MFENVIGLSFDGKAASISSFRDCSFSGLLTRRNTVNVALVPVVSLPAILQTCKPTINIWLGALLT